MRIIYTSRSLTHLMNIRDYLSENAPDYQEFVLSGLLDKIDALVNMPRRGTVVSGVSDDSREVRVALFASYKIYYGIEGEYIKIYSVFHQKQEHSNLIVF